MKKAIFPLSADPITLGHLDIIKRATKIFDKVWIVILENKSKTPLLTIEERVVLVKKCLQQLSTTLDIEVETFSGLLADYALKKNIFVIVRGIRNSIDLEYEDFIEFGNHQQYNQLEFCYLLSKSQYRHITSSAAKTILLEQGQIDAFVPYPVKQKLEQKILKQYKVLIAGGIASGKSYLLDHWVPYLKQKGIQVTQIDFDLVVAEIYQEMSTGRLETLQIQIKEYFKEIGEITDQYGYVIQKKVSKVVFSTSDPKQHLLFLEKVLSPYILLKYRTKLSQQKGIIFLNAPVDSLGNKKTFNILQESNYNIILVDVNEKMQIERVMKKFHLNPKEAEKRVKANSSAIKKDLLTKEISLKKGKLFIYLNNREIEKKHLQELTNQVIHCFQLPF